MVSTVSAGPARVTVSLFLEFVSSIPPAVGSPYPNLSPIRSPDPILPLETGSFSYRSSYQSPSQSSPIPTSAYSPPTRDPSPYPASSPLPCNPVSHPSQVQAIGLEATLNRFAFQPPYQPRAIKQPSPSSIARGSQASRLTAASIVQVAPLRKVPKRDAYKAFRSPTSSWSTISSEKKRKQKRNDQNNHLTTTNFRLRLPRVDATNEQRTVRKNNETEAVDAKPRVVTYLPPPPIAPPREQASDANPARPSPRNDSGSHASLCEGGPDLPPAFRPMAIRRAAVPHMSLSTYPNPVRRPPSGRPVSERPSPYREAAYNTGGDMTLTFNQSGLPQRYSSLRRSITKVGGFVRRTACCPMSPPGAYYFNGDTVDESVRSSANACLLRSGTFWDCPVVASSFGTNGGGSSAKAQRRIRRTRLPASRSLWTTRCESFTGQVRGKQSGPWRKASVGREDHPTSGSFALGRTVHDCGPLFLSCR